jgi:uroporphyrinogen decarboxylase
MWRLIVNSRERVRTALSHQSPDRAPLALWLTPEVCLRLQKHLGVDSEIAVLDALDIDVRWLLVDYIGPALQQGSDGSQSDEFGVRRRTVQNEFGGYDEIVVHPLGSTRTVSDVENFRWPDPDWWDYGSIQREIAQADRAQPRWLGVGYASLFERAWNLMGFEKLMYDLADRPAVIEAVLDRLLNFYLEQTHRILEAARGRIDMIYIADDLGGQQSLLISPQSFEQYVQPRWKRFIDTIKGRFGNVAFHFHSCGAVRPLIPKLIETGIDILNPIQPKAPGMDAQSLKDDFSDWLSFCGGFDIQDLLPHGSVSDIRNEAWRLIRILGANGGYIASPAHAVQPDTPIENVLAMIEGFTE